MDRLGRPENRVRRTAIKRPAMPAQAATLWTARGAVRASMTGPGNAVRRVGFEFWLHPHYTRKPKLIQADPS